MIAHLVQWLALGTTLAPIEPSESMQTVKDGIVTVGGIFFAVALLSTALLGRWFCGWGCHWVAIQDATAWALARAGIRPKPFRSRLLMWMPLALALYMFAWPLLYRFALAPWVQPDLRWPGFIRAQRQAARRQQRNTCCATNDSVAELPVLRAAPSAANRRP
jgi:hypothetical protein